MRLQFHVLFSSFEFHCRENLLNYTFRKTPWKNRHNIPGSLNPKQPGAALLWACICWKIVPNSRHSLHSDTTDNYGQYDSIPSSQVSGAFNRCYFFMQITIKIVSVAFSASRQLQTLLLAWRERDESLTWWWQSIFFFPHYFPLALAVNKSPAVYILSPALERLWRENRGSVNKLRLTSKCRVRKYDLWIYHSVQVFPFISKWQRQLNNMLRLVILYVDTSMCASLAICCWRETLKNDSKSRNNETPVIW